MSLTVRKAAHGSGMGVDSADYDEDGWMDLFVANIDLDFFAVSQQHDGTFDESAVPQGIGMSTRWMSGGTEVF